MFERILIAADNSELILNGVEYTSILFPKSTYHVLSIIDTRDRSVQLTKLLLEMKKKYCEESVENSAKILEEKGIDVLKVVSKGRPSKEILSYIEKNRIDLLLVATHAFTSVKRLHMGKTCRSVLERVKIPVIIFSAPAELKVPARILNPTTGSRYSKRATELAMRLGSRYNSPVTTVAYGEVELERILKDAEGVAKFYGVEFKGVTSEAKCVEECMIEHFKDHDLCVGSRGSKSVLYHFRAIYKGFALGKTEKETIVESSIPMLLIGEEVWK